MPVFPKNQAGFTLLELLLVVAILAIVSGSLYIIYDPMEAKALKSRNTADLATAERGVRTLRSLSGAYPNFLDNLIVDSLSIAEPASDNQDGNIGARPLDGLSPQTTNDLGSYILNSAALQSLRSSGLDHLWFFPKENAGHDQVGFSRAMNVGDRVAAFQSGCQNMPFIEGFAHQSPHDSSILHHQIGLDPMKCHLVVMFGLGKHASIISNPDGRNSVTLSNVPHYSNLSGSSYNNFLLLFHLGTSEDAQFDSSEIFPSAKFAGIYNPTPSIKMASASFSIN